MAVVLALITFNPYAEGVSGLSHFRSLLWKAPHCRYHDTMQMGNSWWTHAVVHTEGLVDN